MKLREYQRIALRTLWDHFAEEDHDNALLVIPTGGGKTTGITRHLIKALVKAKPGANVLFVAHLQSLIIDTYEKMQPLAKDLGCTIGIYCGGLERKEWGQLTIATIQSLNHLEKLPVVPDLVIIDEAHSIPNVDDTMYRRFISGLPEHTRVLGLTATPYRLDGGLIYGPQKLFRRITAQVTIEELVDEGYLVPARMAGAKEQMEIDTEGVSMTAGDFNLSELASRANIKPLIRRQVEDALKRTAGRQQVVWFCTDISHAENVAEEISRYEPACVIHSRMETDFRKKQMAAFVAGKVRHCVNVNVLAEGFDHPPVDTIVLLRPTKSAARYIQMVGRGLRPWEDKTECLVLDYAGVVRAMGPITDPIVSIKNTTKGSAVINPLKCCPNCLEYVAAQVRECPECNHMFPIRRNQGEATVQDGQIMGKRRQRRLVSRWTYGEYQSKAGNLVLRIVYMHGLNSITNEYLMFHPGQIERTRSILTSLGVLNAKSVGNVEQALEALDDVCRRGQDTKLSAIIVEPDGKYNRVIQRIPVAEKEAVNV